METATLASETRTEHTGLFFLPEMALKAIDGALAGRTFAVHGDGASLGREGTIALRTTGVSRRHASLRYSFGRFFVVDLGSRNGTFVNGQRVVGEQALEPRDVVQIAEHRFIVSLGGSSNDNGLEPLAVKGAAQPLELRGPLVPGPREARSRSSLPLVIISLGGLALLLLPSLGWKRLGHRQASAASLEAGLAKSTAAAAPPAIVDERRAPPNVMHSDVSPIQVIRLPTVNLAPTHPVRNHDEKVQTTATRRADVPRISHRHNQSGLASRPSPPALDAQDTATLQQLASEALDVYRDARHRYYDVLESHGDPATLLEVRHALDQARNRARALRLALPGDPPVK